MQNIRKILRLDSENNSYKVVGQSWGKKNFFKAFLIVTFVYLKSSILTNHSGRVLVVDFENSVLEVLHLVRGKIFGQ